MAKYSPKTKLKLKELVDDESINLGDIDTSAITSMNALFQQSERTDFSGIEKWDTSNVTDMMDMFNCAEHFNHNINDWNVSKVVNMAFMFESTPFNQPLDKWDVSNVGTMDCMFMNAKNFNQNISMWDTSNVESMEGMFSGAKSFNQNLDNWQNMRLRYIQGMFNKSPLAYNPPEWYFGYQERFFERYYDVNDIKDSMEFEEDEPIYTPKNWDELKNLVDNKFIHLGNIDTSAIDDMSELFENSDRTNFDGIEKWDTSNVTSMSYMFSGAKHFNNNINDWNVSKVENMSGMFCEAESFNQPLDLWNVSKVEDMRSMFDEASSFNQPLDKWDTSNVTDMSYMFSGAKHFNNNINDWNVSKVESMSSMFYDCPMQDNLPDWYNDESDDDE